MKKPFPPRGRPPRSGRPDGAGDDRPRSADRGRSDAAGRSDARSDRDGGPPRGKRPPRKEPPGLPARRAAVSILDLVRGGRSLDEALEECRDFDALEGRDRAFARLLASTALRRRGSADALIAKFMETPLPRRADRASDLLRLAVVQTAFLGVDAHAAIDTAVAVARGYRETAGYAGLINAVGRKLAAQSTEAVAALPERSDTPGWLWRSWERAYGPATARAIALAHRNEPPLDLTPKVAADAPGLAEKLGGAVLPTGSIRLKDAGPVPALGGFAEGAWWVQDAAAALPAKLLGDIVGREVLDLCAAPGGKTMQLAAAGARVVAIDSVGDRLKRVQDNLARVGLAAETVKADVLEWTPDRRWPFILLDAPCTATGTLRRRPDVAWALREDDVATMARVQTRMLARAATLLEPGGTLVFATCSLQPDEGEAQIRTFLEGRADLARAPVRPDEVGGLAAAVTGEGDVRTLPSIWAEQGGMDGFFAARLTKR